MTTWLATKTTRFKAIETDRTITDWTYWYGSSDAQGLTGSSSTATVGQPEAVRRTLAHPLREQGEDAVLIVQSEEDHRTPMGSAEIWFMSLKKQGVPVELVRYRAPTTI